MLIPLACPNRFLSPRPFVGLELLVFTCATMKTLHFMTVVCFSHTDQLRNSYQVGNDHSLRVIYANGMDTHYQTEPHILAGTHTTNQLSPV